MTQATDIAHSPLTILSVILDLAGDSPGRLIPLLRETVAAGNHPFGAAVISKTTLEPVVRSVNKARTEYPLLHGETNCIKEFFMIPAATAADAAMEPKPDGSRASRSACRPSPKECIFFATHEPCALCLSAIAWAGFPLVYYLFSHEETRDAGHPKDIDVLEALFRVPVPGVADDVAAGLPRYNKTNKYFSARSVSELLEYVEDPAKRQDLTMMLCKVKALYDEFKET